MTADLNSYLFVGAVLFVCGVICMATKRNGIGVLMGVELVLKGPTLTSSPSRSTQTSGSMVR